MLQMAFDPLFLSAQRDCRRWSLSMGKVCGYSNGQITSLVCTGETQSSGSSALEVTGRWRPGKVANVLLLVEKCESDWWLE